VASPQLRPAVNRRMTDALREFFDRLLGLSLQAGELHFSHMAARAVIVFAFAVMLARLGDRRFLGHSAGFDIMVAIILGSVLSRGINGQAAFFPTLGVSGLLVLLHHLMAKLAFHSHRFSWLIKGSPRSLVRDGKPVDRELRRSSITRHDLDEHLRLQGGVIGTSDVLEARLERNGSVSVVKAKDAE
jgi:uncharacterized membrane protein YcaP (DUF421 family)